MTEPYQPPAADGLLRGSQTPPTGLLPAPAVAFEARPSYAGPSVRGADHQAGRHPRGQPGRLLRSWLVAFGFLFVASAAWAFASPLGSGPDEPAHLVRAVSLVRGQLVGKPLPHPTQAQKSTVIVKVPTVFASLANDVECFQYKPGVPAGCQHPLKTSTLPVSTQTYVGRYPPLYYALVGLPTLALVSVKGIYGARLVSCALSAALLALAVTSIRRCRGAPLLAAGIGLAVTPMVLYLAAVINPSGLEIASAISAWAAAMALASQGADEISHATVAALGLSISVLVLTRALTPLWVVVIAAAFFGLGPAAPLKALARDRHVQAWFVVCAAAGAAALAWDLWADPFLTEPGSPLPHGSTGADIFVLALERLDLLISSSIGQFGWLDTLSPTGVIVTWLGAFGAVVLVGLCLARRREAAVVVGTLAAWVVLPTGLIMSVARQEGIVGQGRDYLALAVGIPLVAAVVVRQRLVDGRTTLRLVTIVVALLAACQLFDFYGALRRNTVGTQGLLMRLQR